ncbi:MAG: hypothetical protein EXS37_19200 [Opitutus sp.]|nr:hypothetical protein [Opitutus sp.]
MRSSFRFLTTPPAEPRGEEFTRLLVGHQRRIQGLILALVTRGPDADDVMQETCAVMWRKFGGKPEGVNPLVAGGLISIARPLATTAAISGLTPSGRPAKERLGRIHSLLGNWICRGGGV